MTRSQPIARLVTGGFLAACMGCASAMDGGKGTTPPATTNVISPARVADPAKMTTSNGTLLATTNGPAIADKLRQLYEDQEFRIVAVDYGHHASPQTPGLYVQARKNQNWVRIEKVSTKDSILGRSPTFEECRAAGTFPSSIDWDFSPLAKQDYVQLPLAFGGFLFFPDKIERQEEKGLLVFRFGSGWKIAPVETVLSVSLADLRQVLEPYDTGQPPGASGGTTAQP